jgi:thiamine-phosphate pyrophosphorylase
MMICLVTDRRQRAPIEQASEAAAAGVDLIHVRERDLEARELAALVDALVKVTRGSATRVVVNDRVDVALACGADGVHLRGDSMAAWRVRQMTSDSFVIGCSVHASDEAVAVAADVDYLVAGTVFPTPSKPEVTRFLGADGLARIARSVHVPVLAIGGVSVERAGEVAAAGARGVAGIGLFANPHQPIKEVVQELRERFNIVGKFP